MRRTLLSFLAPAFGLLPSAGAQSFVNWEVPHVHPLELTPDARTLLAVNTAAGRLEVFDVSGDLPRPLTTIPVGVEPVSVRALSNKRVWVVNHLSDSVSVVDLPTGNVVFTVQTRDEPCDVVFAGTPARAFVSCSQDNVVQAFTLQGAWVADLRIAGEDPRALATSPDRTKVYAAVYESGNGTTILGGGLSGSPVNFPRNVVNDPAGPWAGQNPPPNAGNAFAPAQNPANPPPPRVGLIVRRDPAGTWRDDNGGDWTELVSGAQAPLSSRPVGWTLLDHDVAVIDAGTFDISYADGLMNICMALAVNPQSGEVVLVGTDATNEVRFEPNLAGRFLRVHAARLSPAAAPLAVHDLNPHLDYALPTVAPAERERSIGDPRAVVFRGDGARGWVAGMGSDNLVPVDGTGSRIAAAPTIEVGAGPTGLALDEASGRLFVLNRFAASISVVALATETEVARVPFFDPTPAAIKVGRKHLYDTHANSGLGHASCASCHVDARMDRLAWDLGDPAAEVRPLDGNCSDALCHDWHPMKGPMLTQTFQDIVGKEPHHWRGDRHGLEEFAAAFETLLGDDAQPAAAAMQEFEDFLASIHFPPNPFRRFDNTLPTALHFSGHYTTDRFGPAGLPLPVGNAQRGLELYRPPNTLTGGLACVSCHTLPTGMGPDTILPAQTPIPPGPNGETHLLLVASDGSTQRTMKVAQLRNLYERTGMEFTQTTSTAGFGFFHDGAIDSLARFIDLPAFSITSVQDTADLVAFLLSFAGSDLPPGNSNPLEAVGPASRDTHAAVGAQVTFTTAANQPADDLLRYGEMLALADTGAVGLIAKGRVAGIPRGWAYGANNTWRSDREGEFVGGDALPFLAGPGSEITVTVVPRGTQIRLGIDRDEDGFRDRDELELIADPDDALSTPLSNLVAYCFGNGERTPCPCGNDDIGGVGGCRNSSGGGARLEATGNASAVGGTLRFTVSGAPAATFGVLVSGVRALPQADPGAGIAALDGLRCVGGALFRHGTRASDGNGAIGSTNAGWGPPHGPAGGIAAQGGYVPGQSRFFQVFLRENQLAGCGSGETMSSAVRVTFQ